MAARLALCSLALALCSCHRELNMGQQKWLELSSEHFVLRTDLDEADARRDLAQLEETRSVFLRALAWGGAKDLPARPFLVVEVADAVELHEFSREELLGFVAPLPYGEQVVVIFGDAAPENQNVLKHELAHAVAGSKLRRQPAWFAEGLAVFLEGTKRDPASGRDIVGEIDAGKAQWLAQHTPMTAAQVLATPGAVGLEGNEGARFELSAWELFHALFNARPAALEAFMHMLANGDDPQAAFRAAFSDLTPEKLDALVLESQEQGSKYKKLGVPIEPYRGGISVRALPPADLHAQLGILFELSPGIDDRLPNRHRARVEFAASLAIDPGNPEALRGHFALDPITAAQRIEQARRAVSLHPDSWHAQLLLVDALQNATDPGSIDESFAAARRAAQLAPEQSDALAIYAVMLAGHHQPELALPIARQAVELDPSNPNALAALARVLEEAGQIDQALAMLERAVEATPERAGSAFREMIKSLRGRLEAEQISALSIKSAAATQDPVLARQSVSKSYPHDARVQIDRAPSHMSCPTPGPAASQPTGQLEVRYRVGDDGKVKQVDAVAGDLASLEPVRRWLLTCTFEPGRRGGQPIDTEVREVFTFR